MAASLAGAIFVVVIDVSVLINYRAPAAVGLPQPHWQATLFGMCTRQRGQERTQELAPGRHLAQLMPETASAVDPQRLSSLCDAVVAQTARRSRRRPPCTRASRP